MTTIISLSSPVNEMSELVSNWDQVSESAKTFMMNGTDFRVMNPQEMLVYNGRQIIASCSIHIMSNNLYIENCWTKEGKLY